jgi:tetratricopeptide (TPR) repeat protein
VARKYTRKQLKQPDEFITLSHKVWVWVRGHATRVAAMLVTTIVIVAAVWTWSYLQRRARERATIEIIDGFETYERSVIADDDSTQESTGGSDDKAPFESKEAKLDATIAQFSKVIAERGPDSDLGEVTLVVRGSAYLERGKLDEAIADYQNYLKSATEDGQLYRLAVEGLIYAFEAKKAWDDALQAVKRLPREGEQQFEALYHEARLLAGKGDTKGAIERYQRIAKDAESQELGKRAKRWLAALEQGA